MAPRYTEKYVAALRFAKALRINAENSTNDELYQALANRGYLWDSDKRTWRIQKPSDESEFLDEKGKPSGVFKLHITAHKDEIKLIAWHIEKALKQEGLPIELVNGPIPNKRGHGYLIYYAGRRSK